MIWIERTVWIALVMFMYARSVMHYRKWQKVSKLYRRVMDASRLIAVAANRDIREYDASLITEDRRKRGDDTSIMVVARVSVWREFIAAIKGE